MVFPVAVRQGGGFFGCEIGELIFDQQVQIPPEIIQKQTIVWRSQQGQKLIVVSLEMLKQMQKDGVSAVTFKYVLMLVHSR